MIQITAAQVFNQLKADLIGKDSYRGVSLSYSWLANQFGHFSLGYFTALICYSIKVKIFTICIEPTLLQSVLSSAIIWTIFESFNFLGPLLFKMNSTKVKLNVHDSYTFKPDWLNVGFDTFTDLLYFYLGALFLALFKSQYAYLDYLFFALLILIFIPFVYWYKTKIILQNCKFPQQIRLSQWKFDLNEEQKSMVLNFISKETKETHLLITGKPGVGKTTLSIGISTEMAIKREKISYFTSMKLVPLFFSNNKNENTNGIWDWVDSDCLIIDDINPSEPVNDVWISPEVFINYIYNPSENRDNRSLLKSKKVIWLIDGKEKIEDWMKMLNIVGIERDKIAHLNIY
jgi:hypothetical protein